VDEGKNRPISRGNQSYN